MTGSLIHPGVRVDEIRACNHQGDVSAKDIAWLCDVAEFVGRALRDLSPSPDGGYGQDNAESWKEAYIARLLEIRAAESDLRREWWLNHGHDGLYGDDGEMQCGRCPADFKRQPLDDLREIVFNARLARAAEAR